MMITVNGTEVEVPDGASIVIRGGVLHVNGKPWEGGKLAGEVKLKVEGGLISLFLDKGSVTLDGDVSGDVTCGGSAHVSGSVGGKVDAGGSISCGDVRGSIDCGGSVHCGSVGGHVDAGGSVRYG
jgi:hypothetical protein